jgi:hypothetical protein
MGLVALYLTLMTEATWRLLLQDLPPWYTVYPQSQHWLKVGVYVAYRMRQALRKRLPVTQRHNAPPAAVIYVSRTLIDVQKLHLGRLRQGQMPLRLSRPQDD